MKTKNQAGQRGGGVVGLTGVQLARLRRRLRAAACSEPWVEAQLRPVEGAPVHGRPTTRMIHDAGAFPPGGRRRTGMRWCRVCGRYTPAPCVSLIERLDGFSGGVLCATLACDDCRLAEDADLHRELYDACPHLRPAGSSTVVGAARNLGSLHAPCT